MPAKSQSQQRLMAAAEHGSNFPKAKALRASMTMSELGDYARGPMKGKPERVKSFNPAKNLGKYHHKPKGR